MGDIANSGDLSIRSTISVLEPAILQHFVRRVHSDINLFQSTSMAIFIGGAGSSVEIPTFLSLNGGLSAGPQNVSMVGDLRGDGSLYVEGLSAALGLQAHIGHTEKNSYHQLQVLPLAFLL